MNNLILIIPSFFSAVFSFCQTPADDSHWQLVWEDNFNTFNPTIWKKSHLFDGYGQSDKLVYLDQNVTVNNGNLVLSIKRENFSCPSWAVEPNWFCVNQYNTGLPYSYTSGHVASKQAYNTQFGYIEARIKVPFGYGLWPAFWVSIGDGVSNPSNAAEIDIFEILGGTYYTPNTITTNYHLNYPPNTQHIKHIFGGFSYVEWHTYAIEWSPSKIIWYLDDVPFRIIQNPEIIDPVRIIFNISGESDKYAPKPETPFPFEMLVDYVRVYELNHTYCNTDKSYCGTDFNSFLTWYPLTFKYVYKTITLGNSNSCINALSPGHDIHMRASQGILINGDFTVPVGAELYLDANACD